MNPAIATFTVTVCVDLENNAETFWDAIREGAAKDIVSRWPVLNSVLFGRGGVANMSLSGAGELEDLHAALATIPGWDEIGRAHV